MMISVTSRTLANSAALLLLLLAAAPAEPTAHHPWTPFQVSVMPPRPASGKPAIALFSPDRDVYGIAFGVPWGSVPYMRGIQIGLPSAEAQDFLGIQFSLFSNLVMTNLATMNSGTTTVAEVTAPRGQIGKAVGVQAAGIFNMAQDMTGLQLAGLATAAGTIRGIQVAPLIAGSRFMSGISVAGGNTFHCHLEGIALAALFNGAATFHGVQVAGLANVGVLVFADMFADSDVPLGELGQDPSSADLGGGVPGCWRQGFRSDGLQLAFLGNASVGLRGVQASAGFNYCENMTGLQLGLVNYAKSLKGVQIGAVNMVQDQKLPFVPIVNASF